MLSIIPLSSRESEIYSLLLKGKKLQRIADELGLKRCTVASHVQNIYNKKSVNSRAELLVNRIEELQNQLNVYA